jgi:hypothetical protein
MERLLETYLSAAQPGSVAVARPAELKTASRRDLDDNIILKAKGF